MPDGIEIKVRAPGAKTATKDVRDLARAEEQVGRRGRKAGKDTEKGFTGVRGALNRAAAAVKGFVASFLGIRAVIGAVRALREEIEATWRTTEKTARALRGVMALSTLGKARPEVQKDILGFQRAAGRAEIGEAAGAYYAFLGGTAGMAPERQKALLQQVALMAQTDKTADLASLAGMFSTIGTQQPDLTPQQIGNLVSATIERAKATPSEMAAYLPAILTTAQAGKADITTATAAFSFGTRRGGGVATSGTAVRAMLLGLISPAPDVAKAMGQYGYRPGMNLMDRIGWLARAGPQLPPELVAGLGGRRGLEAVAGISADPAAFRAEVGAMRGALGAPGSLLGQRLRAMYAGDPLQAILSDLEDVRIQREQMRITPEALQEQRDMDMLDIVMRRSGEPTLNRRLINWLLERWRDLGLKPGKIVSDVRVDRQVNIGGTHFHGTYQDPAGQPVEEVAE